MDDKPKSDNNISISTYEIIITKNHEIEARWSLRFDSILNQIKVRDQAIEDRLRAMNEFRGALNDQLNRCATKEETQLEVNKAVAALEKSITLNFVTLDSKIRAVDIIQKVLISIVLGIILLVSADYIRGV